MARALPSGAGREDLIAAPATAPGRAAIAIVRMSGKGALQAADRLFGGMLQGAGPGRLVLGTLRHPETRGAVDSCLAVHWRAPRSYTGEDLVEFHLHGSPVVVEAALEACGAAGARLAEAGEFTRRAYLNGRLDLAQAEAVAHLTQARTEAGRRAALAQLRGGLSRRLMELRSALVQTAAELEAAIDYPEEDIPEPAVERHLGAVRDALKGVSSLLATSRRGRALHEGARAVLAGRPNAGKSSLFNTLLGRERAIVTPHPGTTRDTLEATIDLGGVPLTLVDTAGLRPDPEEIEALGIGRSREELLAAQVVLFLVDAMRPDPHAAEEYAALATLRHFIVYTKTDLAPADSAPQATLRPHEGTCAGELRISVKTREGLDALETALLREIAGTESEGGSLPAAASARQEEALRRAADGLEAAARNLRERAPVELVSVDLTGALSAMDSVLGLDSLDEDVLDAVFATFCLGK